MFPSVSLGTVTEYEGASSSVVNPVGGNFLGGDKSLGIVPVSTLFTGVSVENRRLPDGSLLVPCPPGCIPECNKDSIVGEVVANDKLSEGMPIINVGGAVDGMSLSKFLNKMQFFFIIIKRHSVSYRVISQLEDMTFQNEWRRGTCRTSPAVASSKLSGPPSSEYGCMPSW